LKKIFNRLFKVTVFSQQKSAGSMTARNLVKNITEIKQNETKKFISVVKIESGKSHKNVRYLKVDLLILTTV
jgi:SepF-like predicted cell division protein (DUF552 family)